MLTVDEVRAIPLFSQLPQAELERLARTAADVHLGSGEYAVHEGGERALYAVIAGRSRSSNYSTALSAPWVGAIRATYSGKCR